MLKRLDPWKGKHLTSGGRQILTNSCLSSIPLYCMGFYWLVDGAHKKMDGIRASFLWQGADGKFKYHMAKWEMISRPKDQGGLGIINTRIMNDCLLVKWIWKILQEPDELWFKLIKAKYLDGCNFFSAPRKGSSQFWQGLHKVKNLFKWGAIFKVRNGLNCRFWQDCWLLDVPLKVAYEDLFILARDPEVIVADCWADNDWWVDFKRTLSVKDFERWSELKEELNKITLEEDNSDIVTWALEGKGGFSAKSLYRFLTDGGMPSRVAGYIWKCRVPMKIKFFLWQIFNNKLQCVVSLVKRGWRGGDSCCLGDGGESVNHIFFGCCVATMVWGFPPGNL